MPSNYLPLCALVLLVSLPGAAQRVIQPVLKPIAYMGQYTQPGNIVELIAGEFFIEPVSQDQYFVRVSASGKQAIVAEFMPAQGTSGSNLVSGADGRLYVTLYLPNRLNSVVSVGANGRPIVYPQISPEPAFTQNLPDGGLLAYGADQSQVFSVLLGDLKGEVKALYSFPTGTRISSVILGTDGNYYGTNNGSQDSPGFVFRVSPGGTLTNIYSFPAGSNLTVTIPFIQATDGNFYGALPNAGVYGTGVLFRLTPGGQYTELYRFPKGYYFNPQSLMEADDGNLYGTTLGFFAASLVFQLTKAGQYKTVAEMSPNGIGQCYCSLIQGSDGKLYGSAQSGGAYGGGSVFSVDLGLPKPQPRVPSFEPASGPVGTQVLLWGSNLLSPSSVEFNGVPAVQVTGNGPNYILATVPPGASSGPITVTTAGGAFVTQASFKVE